MHIKKLRVKARQAPFHEPCAAEMTAMLGCWAATKDSMSVGPCAQAAQGLFACMRTVPGRTRPHQPAINYHLARLGKNFKS
ncbi:hypothetical protein PENSPDRAFT_752560 [Peniophora sp. CONT]|nr:hypothetical protein PENSPDRAFT_752560 [Peniophora sp. CONT]